MIHGSAGLTLAGCKLSLAPGRTTRTPPDSGDGESFRTYRRSSSASLSDASWSRALGCPVGLLVLEESDTAL